MNTQHSWGTGARARLSAGEAIHAGRGRLEVVEGVVWLTRRGDPQDHLLERGEAFEIRAHDDVLFESWGKAQSLVDWQPFDRSGRLQREAAGLGASLLRSAAVRCSEAAAGLMSAADRLARLTGPVTNGAARGNCSA